MITLYASQIPRGARLAPCTSCRGIVAASERKLTATTYSCVMCSRPALVIIDGAPPPPPPPPGDWFSERICIVAECSEPAYPRSKAGYCDGHRDNSKHAVRMRKRKQRAEAQEV